MFLLPRPRRELVPDRADLESLRMRPGWQRVLLSGGLLEGSGDTRTVRDWIVDVAIVVVAVVLGRVRAGLDLGARTATRSRCSTSRSAASPASRCSGGAPPAGGRAADRPAVGGLGAGRDGDAAGGLQRRDPACRCERWPAIVALAVAGTAIFPLLYPEVDGRGYGWQLTVGLLLTAVALGWGLFVRAQRELFKGLRERGQEKAREAERRRIAREMHDVLAHRLSILSVHAGALENAGDRLPPEYAETAKVIRTSARTALEELREVIGLLRREETSGVEPPQPTLDQLPALIEESRAAGLTVDYEPWRTTRSRPRRPDRLPRDPGGPDQRAQARRRATRCSSRSTTARRSSSSSSATAPRQRRCRAPGRGWSGLAERVELAGGELDLRARATARSSCRRGFRGDPRPARRRRPAAALGPEADARAGGGDRGGRRRPATATRCWPRSTATGPTSC